MKICTLITTFNRSQLLQNSLERMTHLTKPDELLVVDDGSTDNTEQVVKSFEGRLPIRYIYNNNPNWSICSYARNIGVKNTDADLIITTEPEMIWITDIVQLIKQEREKYPDEIISTSIIYHGQPASQYNPGFETEPTEALKGEVVENYQTEPRSYHPKGFVKTINMQATFIASYERKWLMDIGGWDEAFPGCWGVDDIDLCTRLRINGINQHVCKKLKAIHQFHSHPPQEDWTLGQSLNWKYFESKKLNKVEEDIFNKKRLGQYNEIDPRLISNQEKEWGVVKPR